MTKLGRILAIGVVLSDVDNAAGRIGDNLSNSKEWEIEQKWVAIGSAEPGVPLVEHVMAGEPKFSVINRLLAQCSLENIDYLLITDDDIELPAGFLDQYLRLVKQYDFAVAQPARTHDSYIDHFFVERLDGIIARQTMFVEIGPFVSIRKDAIPLLTPFDLTSPMGWGYDFVWPVLLTKAGIKLGIVDATPVRHRLRKPVTNYAHGRASQQMEAYLVANAHLDPARAFYIVNSYS